MKILVVGCGRVGSEIARDLAHATDVSEVVVVDTSPPNFLHLKNVRKVTTVSADVFSGSTLKRLLSDCDVVCGALPGRLGFKLMDFIVESGKNLVDISYTPVDPFKLNREARRNGCLVVPQCGVAPGLSNMCVGNAHSLLDDVETVRIMVGGLPQHPDPPLNYRFVFSPDDTINEYNRPVTIIEKGRPKVVEALSGRGRVHFSRVGELEYFLTDGLGTLPHSLKDVDEMCEYTLRYPGHAAMMSCLRSLGFFGQDPLLVDGVPVVPRMLLLELLKPLLVRGGEEDLLAFRIDVNGEQNGRKTRIRYQMLDVYDHRRGISAMARTTAYPCTAVALLVGRGKIDGVGIVTPEKIAGDPSTFRFIKQYLKDRRVRLRVQMSRILAS